ncbi:MAG: DUF3560 domain-containing protein [Saprospiraceae bacterium]|nr:DUF3560 domain-containing protein [Saprospiraceae bacterium]
MKTNYHERKEARIENAERLASKNEEAANASLNTANRISSYIPLGQPILVGHHSEKRHRRDIERIDNNMRNSVEASKKAEYYKDKAESIAANTSISSDNPDAIQELKDKIEKLEKKQDFYKAINKICSSKKTSKEEKIKLVMDFNVTEQVATEFITGERNYGHAGIPSYKLTNNGSTIRTAKKRLAQLEKTAALKDSSQIFGDVELIISVTKNRVQIIFPDKPAEETRKELKSYGFKWSPNEGAWQRMISDAAIYYAKKIILSLTVKNEEHDTTTI